MRQVWDSIWLPEARKKLVEASQRVQALNDVYLRGEHEMS